MQREVDAVPEDVVRLRVNGQSVATWSCTPDALEALGVGRLLALGFIRSGTDVSHLSITGVGSDDGITIEAEVEPARVAEALEHREHRRRHGCGLRFVTICRPDLLPPRAADAPDPQLDRFPDLFRALFDRSDSRRSTGGHHTAALCDGRSLLYLHEEVGRHNAADKAIGGALLQGEALGTLGIITTARISAETAEKAARAGLAWIASRSVPTTLAVEIAGAAGIPIVARAASPDARTFRPGDVG